MSQLEERIFEDIGRCFTDTPHLLMGDADWFDPAKGLDTQVYYTSCTPDNKMDCIRFAGAVIYSNGMAGTRGWIVGDEESIMRMRNAVWAAQYIYVFNGAPDGMAALYGRLMEQPGARK